MEIRELLSAYPKDKVDVFIGYLNHLGTEKKDGQLKAYWFSNITTEQFANAFKKVAAQGLFIDGESVSIAYRKKLVINFDYHAYKNKVQIAHPETIFDFGVVYESDTFSFTKKSGRVVYTHEINDPFKNNKVIVGAYGIIKNDQGEFIEVLNMDDINKMKNTSQMKTIWDAWFDRMVLKSVIKRICNIHFHDLTESIDSIDNETNDPDLALLNTDVQSEIFEAETEESLRLIYNEWINKVEDKNALLKLLGDRRKQIQSKAESND